MIDSNIIFDELGESAAIWVSAGGDPCKLAGIAEMAVSRGVYAISIAPDDVAVMWPWMEKTDVRIFSRFYMPPRASGDDGVSDMTRRIMAAFRSGAVGAQVFVPRGDIARFVSNLSPIVGDLFFNKELSLGIDVLEIDASDWGDVFAAAKKMNASSILFALTRDAGDKSDFVGRIYGMINAVGDFGGQLHFYAGKNPLRIEQARRLVHALRPELEARCRFFIND